MHTEDEHADATTHSPLRRRERETLLALSVCTAGTALTPTAPQSPTSDRVAHHKASQSTARSGSRANLRAQL